MIRVWLVRVVFIIGAMGVVIGASACSGDPGTGSSSKPRVSSSPYRHIILVVVDTLRRDHLSCYGSTVRTPNIDALAAQGQMLTNAFSSFHQTTMSMASLFTGLTPSLDKGRDRLNVGWSRDTWGGLIRFQNPREEVEGASIPSSVETLAEALSAVGYWTIGIVSNRLMYRPGGYERGFDVWVELSEKPPIRHPEVTRALEETLARGTHERVFLYVHYMDVHDPTVPSYAQRVEVLDGAIGDLMAVLEREGMLQDSLIVFTSDHGDRLGERHFTKGTPTHFGNPSFDELLKIPLIIVPPVLDDTARIMRSDDVHRMIRRLADAAEGPDPELEPGEVFVSEMWYQTYRKGRWKSFRNRATGSIALVDLQSDRGETHDVADAHRDVVEAHARRIEELERRLGAPGAPETSLAPEDLERLRALGYVH